MKIAIYSRKSKFTGKGESVENQIEMCREYIRGQKNRFPDIKEDDIQIFEDEGYSGKDLNRPQFQKMIALARQKRFNCIICYRLDRISRSVSDFSALLEELNRLGISIICIKEAFDTSNPMGKAMMYIASVFAQLERETIAERVRDNMLMLARTGRWLGGTTPTGFTSEKENTIIMDDGKARTSCKLKWNPDEMNVVRAIYDKFMELHSLSGVGKYLIRQKVCSRSGKPFSVLGIKDILRNPVYCMADQDARSYFLEKGSHVCFEAQDCSDRYGLMSYNKRDYARKPSPRLDESEWIIAIGKHRGIIPGRDWMATQKMLAENRPTDPNHTDVRNDYALLSGLIICAKCHGRMFAKRRSNNANLYDYICSNKQKGNSDLCDCPNLNGPETDDRVCRELMGFMTEGSEEWKQFEKLRQKLKAEADAANPLQEVEAQIADAKTKTQNYVQLLERPDLGDALIRQVSRQVTALSKKLEELERRKKILLSQKGKQENDQLQFDVLIELLSHFKNWFPLLSVQERGALIRTVADRIEWDGENLHIFICGE